MADHLREAHYFETEQDARVASRALAIGFIRGLESRGYSKFTPAERPTSPEVIWDEFNHCRILIQWMPDWIEHPMAGKFGLRLDTLAERA